MEHEQVRVDEELSRSALSCQNAVHEF